MLLSLLLLCAAEEEGNPARYAGEIGYVRTMCANDNSECVAQDARSGSIESGGRKDQKRRRIENPKASLELSKLDSLEERCVESLVSIFFRQYLLINYFIHLPTATTRYIAAKNLLESLATTADNKNDNTALMYAAEDGYGPMVSLLLADTRVNPATTNQDGNTALMFAAQNGHSSVVRLLLADKRVDPTVANQNGFTALMFAAMKGHVSVATLLLANNRVNPAIANMGGNTALMFAAESGHAPMVNLLLADTRVDSATANKDGNTALMFAAQNGHSSLVTLLLADNRVDHTITNQNGFTALKFAIQNGQTKIADMLLQYDASEDERGMNGTYVRDFYSNNQKLLDRPVLRSNACKSSAACLVPRPKPMERVFVDVVQVHGRTGHKMKDYLTGIILYFLADYKLVFTQCWVFPERDHQNHVGIFNLVDPLMFRDLSETGGAIYLTYAESNWAGMAYEKFSKIISRIEEIKRQNPNRSIILRLEESTRILLSDVYNWEAQGYISRGTYRRITDHLKARYYKLNERVVSSFFPGEIEIAVHIRKGDVHLLPQHTSVKYYENVIRQLKKLRLKKAITIYSEKWSGYDGKDVYALQELQDKLMTINVVFDVCLYEYFSDILRKRVFVPTLGQGSFSDMLLNYRGHSTLVIVNHDHRQSKYVDDMNGTLFKTDPNGEFDVTRLEKKLIDSA